MLTNMKDVENTQCSVDTLPKPKGKVSVKSHGSVYVDKHLEICVCPECGCVELNEQNNDYPKVQSEPGFVIDKTSTTHQYHCRGCGCVFHITNTERKIHRIRGGLGFSVALIGFCCLALSFLGGTVLLVSPTSGTPMPVLSAIWLQLKYCLPLILCLCTIDYKNI